MMIMALSSYGHQIAGLASAVDLTSQILSFNPQLVIIDVHPGNDSGREICKQIKAADAGLAVILMSTTAELLVDYESCLANDILVKPFDILELKNKIERILNSKPEGRTKMRYPILPAFLRWGRGNQAEDFLKGTGDFRNATTYF